MIAPAVSLLDDTGRLLQGGLAVVGATALGALMIGFGSNVFGRFIFGKPLPTPLLRMVRVSGGLAAGLLAGMIVFSGTGGWGLGGGSGTGNASTNATLTSRSVETKPQAIGSLRITLLGGARVKNEAFYLLDGETQARTLPALQTLLSDRAMKKAAPAKLELIVYQDSVAKSHPAVTELEAWAKANQYAVSVETLADTLLPEPKGDRP